MYGITLYLRDANGVLDNQNSLAFKHEYILVIKFCI